LRPCLGFFLVPLLFSSSGGCYSVLCAKLYCRQLCAQPTATCVWLACASVEASPVSWFLPSSLVPHRLSALKNPATGLCSSKKISFIKLFFSPTEVAN